jgi:GTP-binding protein
MRSHWGTLIEAFFRRRQSLRGVIVVMDVRHPLTDNDGDMLALARSRGVPVHVLLTKSDKLGRGAAQKTLAQVRRDAGEAVTVQLFSAFSGSGVAEARGVLERMLDRKPEKETPVGPADPTGECKPGVGG